MSTGRFSDTQTSSYGSISSGSQLNRQYGNDFSELSKDISNKIFKLSNNATVLERTVKKVGTKDDGPATRDKLHTIQQETNTVASEITAMLRDINSGKADRNQRLQLERLNSSFKQALQRYGEIQKNAQERVKSASLSSAQDMAQEHDTWSDEANLLERERRKEQLQQQQLIVEDEVTMAREREARIAQIESDVLNVNEIFKQLGTMVHEQGELVDDIEANTFRAADYVAEGNEQLVTAANYQVNTSDDTKKSYRKKLCCVLVIFLVAGGILALVLGLTLHKSK